MQVKKIRLVGIGVAHMVTIRGPGMHLQKVPKLSNYRRAHHDFRRTSAGAELGVVARQFCPILILIYPNDVLSQTKRRSLLLTGLDINTMQLASYESIFSRLWFGIVIA